MQYHDLTKCNCSGWGKTRRFLTTTEYNQFLIQLSALVSSGYFVKLSNNPHDPEPLYRCLKCGTRWQVFKPDPPVRGFCKQVDA